MDNPAHKPLGWGLAVQLAAREMRDGLAGFRIFLMCLILGISTIAAVGSLSASLVGGMAAQGQAILGGDIDFRLVHRAAFKQERDWLDRQGSVSEIATLRAMIRYGDEAMLAEVKSVDAAYPLYGAVKTAPDTPLSVLSAEPETTGAGGDIYPAMAEKGLFDRLQLAVGDVVSIGDIRLRLMAELAHEPDRTAAGFPLAPRLLVAHATLRAAGLLQPGSLVNFHYRIKLADTASVAEVKAVSAGAAETFPNAGWRIRDRSDASPSLRRFIERLGLFLTLVGLTALVVGGVGVGNAITAYIEKRRESIAVMKALGASGRFVFRIYAAQIAALTLVATGIGLSIGAATPWLLQALAGALLPVELQMALFPRPLLAAAGFGILAAAAFALWPLGRAEKMPVTGLFRNDAPQAAHRPSMFYLAAIGACFAGLLALALVISERRDVALWFGVGVGLSYLALRLTAGAIVLLAGKTAALVSDGRPALRLALANITRPNAPVRPVVLSIGLSVALLSAISMVDGNINRQIQGDLPERTPSFFFLDIQPTQIDQFLSASEAFGGIGDVETLPMLRGQI
ncbi:MAG: FtsX-like permease family protein, partial [Rhodobiaceae bacterium]